MLILTGRQMVVTGAWGVSNTFRKTPFFVESLYVVTMAPKRVRPTGTVHLVQGGASQGMWFNAHKSAFWQAPLAYLQLPECEGFYEAAGAVTPPQAVAISDLQEREKAGTYSGFEIPTEKTLRKIALVMGTDFREFCRTSRLQKPALKRMAELGVLDL